MDIRVTVYQGLVIRVSDYQEFFGVLPLQIRVNYFVQATLE